MRNTPSIQKTLLTMQDSGYKKFQCKLMPTVNPDAVIGVRTPLLRKLLKSVIGEKEYFLHSLPHTYYEENNLHGLLISAMTDADETIVALDVFLPYVDNWATCDLIAPKAFYKHPPHLIPKVLDWINSDHIYTVRFGISVLLRYYLDDTFDSNYLSIVANISSDEYYVKMMIAWYFATALAKQYNAALPYLEQRCLDRWTHNKTIQKAIESYRIMPEQKAYLRTLKLK